MSSIFQNEKSKQKNINEIIAEASFLSELIKGFDGQNNGNSIDEEIAKLRVEEWIQTSAKGDHELFKKRLERDGLTIEQVHHLLGTPSYSLEKAPQYLSTLQKIVEMVPTLAPEKAEVYVDKVKPLPFQELLIPLVLVARYLLLSSWEKFNPVSLENISEVSKEAYLKLEYGLLHRLAQLASKTLLAEFSSQRTIGVQKLLLAIGADKNHVSTTKYNDFVQKHLSEGFLTLFSKYPILARLIATIVGLWVDASREFLTRLEADLPQINQLFNRPHSGKVIDLTTGLSDAHNYGKSVLILTFEDGFKLVYKPKDLSLEIAYNQFLQWFNAQDDRFLPLKIVKVLNRQDYGWMEHIDQLPCTDQDAARRFYQRAGMLLCLLYLLNTNDCHYENLVAHGEHFVLIDGETVMHHTAKYMEEITEKPAHFEAYEKMINSPINTGFLPAYILGPNNVVFDWSALGGIDQPPVKVPKLQNINTDQMFVGQETVTMPRQKNVAFLNGQPLSPNDYIAEILEGYEQMYRFFSNHQETILSENSSPLAAFSQCSVRFLNRATRVYAQALEHATNPQYLKDGRDFSIQLDTLARAYLTTEAKPHNWSMLAAELEQLHRCDIPFFTAEANSETLVLPN